MGEWLLRGSFRVARSRTGRLTASGLAGVAAGAGWGLHLADGPTWPRLLWVSPALSAAAAVAAVGRAGTEDQPSASAGRRWAALAQVAVPPWRWGAGRLAGFALLNLGLAAGILVVQAPSRLL